MAKKFSGEAFALLMQGLAQGLHGIRQRQAQEADDERQNLRLLLEQEHYRQMAEDRKVGREEHRLDRASRESEFADRMASEQDDRALRKRGLDLTEEQHRLTNEDRDLSRQDLSRHRLEEERLRQESIDKRTATVGKASDPALQRLSRIFGAPISTGPQKNLMTEFDSMVGPMLKGKLDDESIVSKMQEPGTVKVDLSKSTDLRSRILQHNDRLREAQQKGQRMGDEEIKVPANGQVELTRADLNRIIADDFGGMQWKNHTDQDLKPMLQRTRSMQERAGEHGVEPELMRAMIGRARTEGEGPQSQPASQPTGMAPQEQSRWSPQSRAGQAGMHVDQRLAESSMPQSGGMLGGSMNNFLQKHHELFSTDPKMRVTAWLDLHTAGFPVLPPTLDFAITNPDGIPQLKPEVAQMIEQAFPGQGKAMAANQMLQSMATADQQMQQNDAALQKQGGGGLLTGKGAPPTGQHGAEQAMKSQSRPKMAPAQTQRGSATGIGFGAESYRR